MKKKKKTWIFILIPLFLKVCDRPDRERMIIGWVEMVKNLEFSESARKSKLNDFEFVRWGSSRSVLDNGTSLKYKKLSENWIFEEKIAQISNYVK